PQHKRIKDERHSPQQPKMHDPSGPPNTERNAVACATPSLRGLPLRAPPTVPMPLILGDVAVPGMPTRPRPATPNWPAPAPDCTPPSIQRPAVKNCSLAKTAPAIVRSCHSIDKGKAGRESINYRR